MHHGDILFCCLAADLEPLGMETMERPVEGEEIPQKTLQLDFFLGGGNSKIFYYRPESSGKMYPI